MTAPAALEDWTSANQRALMNELRALKSSLGGALPNECESETSPALDALGERLGLSPFERRIVLLCAGVELEGSFAAACASAPGSGGNAWPSFGLALAAFPDAHWSALGHHTPLRYWRLVEVIGQGALVANRLQIDERILFFLTGVSQLDERLVRLFALPETSPIADWQVALLEKLETAWKSASGNQAPWPACQLCGPDGAAKRALASALAERLTNRLFCLSAMLLPTNLAELEALHRLWEREAILQNAALFLDCDRAESIDASRDLAIERWIELSHTPLFVSTREPRRELERPMPIFEIRKPTSVEQRRAWQLAIGEGAQGWNGQLDRLVSQFNFSTGAIRATASSLGEKTEANLWHACRLRARPRLEDLAHRISSSATWSDIALPAPQLRTLQTISAQVCQRARVHEEWGFAEKSNRGLGLTALFAGPSGTGKTLAAEILANELELDLFRIDLSAVVSKYIGETEKNLRRVFDAAEDGGAVLLFDEADALFGKRSEVKDSHDRYANVEISYLLQRMEAYRGLAILTTNMKDALDPAFLRRLRFVAQFPFPDQPQRAEIWRRIFPAKTPTDSLDFSRLSRLSISGGNIRSIALNAAFAAAAADEPVQMAHLLGAARSEYAKLEKPLTEAELGDWK
jgi:hypothetical protein